MLSLPPPFFLPPMWVKLYQLVLQRKLLDWEGLCNSINGVN
nr:hypothetical protein Q903MT_gene1230 [Picea sitchensis]